MKNMLYVSFIAVAAACGTTEVGTLTKADVIDIPPGTGTGSAASGSYELELLTTTCVGKCPVIHEGSITVTLCDVGEVLHPGMDVAQTDGALVMDAHGLVLDRLVGGIDGDGMYTAGGWGTQYSGAIDVMIRSTGTLDAARGTFTGTAEARAVGSVDGTDIDCSPLYDVTGARD